MSVRVNLLPEATRSRDQAAQQRLIAAASMLVLLAVLGGVWWWANGQVKDAEERLAEAEQVTAQLRAEETELIAYRDLADRRDRAGQVLQASLGDEVSLAGVLQDLAAVLPADAQLDTLTLTLTPPSVEAGPAVGSMTLAGQTLTSHAPGVEAILLELGKISTFGELYLNSSTLDTEREEPIATYSVSGVVREDARTGRYVEGLPEELR
jgi:Tfp pilus assembly protein PilN